MSNRVRGYVSGALALFVLAACSDSTGDAPTVVDGTSASATAATSNGSGGATTQPTAGGTIVTSATAMGAATSGTKSASVGTTTGAAGSSATGASPTSSGGVGGNGGSSDVLESLRQYLALERAERPELESQDFAHTPLNAADAASARSLLWDDHAAFIAMERAAEAQAKAITIGAHSLRYDFTVFGDEPEAGHSLFISLHGGGEADPSVNDEQWENQKQLYQPDEGIYLAPRAPTNTWNLWHEPHIDALLERLIENFVVLEGVDPNRVYVMGYSAGGDGVYQLGPRMADCWAAAAMMAGHPNDARPESLRNLGFTIHVGGLDTAFDRNLVAGEWELLLDRLEAADPDGYHHYVEVHPDKPHWMDLEDAVAVPWMAGFTRNPLPSRIVWLQDDVTHLRFYWLAVDAENAVAGARIDASVTEQNIEVQGSSDGASPGVSRLRLRLSDEMLDLDQPVRISSGSTTLYEGSVERTILTLSNTTEERGDPALVFSAELTIELP